ncbi:MAG: hypothetical protein FWG45_02360 [Oscillospiraceae bacterium]|nr:hypothetical protein [Oscillospiraceae bacterium]
MNNFKTTNQRIEEISLDCIKMGAYQRPTNSRQVMWITSEFDETWLGIPIVSERDGSYYLLDGNHRVAALRKQNYTHAKFIVLSGLSYEQEAAYFRVQNKNNRPLSKFNLFKAGLEAKDEMCVNIEKIALANGFKISGSRRDSNAITSIFALEIVVEVYGYEVLNDTLSLLGETWNGVKNATNREFIVGVADFVNRFGKQDFARRMKKQKLKDIWQYYIYLVPNGKRASNDPQMRKAFCRVLVDHYNAGIRPDSEKYLRMEARNGES